MKEPEEPDWDCIVERHAERVFRIAFRILGAVHDAEDVCQEVFVEAFELQRRGPIQTWAGLMVRLTTLRAIDRLRARRRPAEILDHDQESRDRPEHELIAAELAEWLRSEVQLLPDQQSAVFSLIYFEQLSRNEVAATLEISPDAVSTTLYKARQRLMSQLAVFQGDRK